jgi:hypothetical protein
MTYHCPIMLARIRPALSLLLLSALPSLGGGSRLEETTLEEVVRSSAWIVEAVPGKPAYSALTARNPKTGWKTEYSAARYVVQRIVKAPNGKRMGVPGTIDVVDDDLASLEMLGERAAGKWIIQKRLPDSVGTCPASGPRLLFLGRPNARAEHPLVSGACLPLSARAKVQAIVERLGGSTDPVEVVEPRLPERPRKQLRKR